MTIPSEDDMDVIEAYCKRAAVSAVADLIRAQGGEVMAAERLALTAGVPIYRPPAPVPVVDPEDGDLDIPRRPVRPQHVTATPVFEDYTPYRSRLRWILPAAMIAGGVGLLVGVVWLVLSIVSATATAVAAAAPSILGILGVVALIVLLASLGGRGGGRGFSGTFSGRMH